MKLTDVIDNLDNTIKGKEELLSRIGAGAMNQLIKINIEELKRIRADLLKVQSSQITS